MIYYTSQRAGNDLWSGTHKRASKATIGAGASLLTASGDILFVEYGVYPEGNLALPQLAQNNRNIVGVGGPVVLDSTGFTNCFRQTNAGLQYRLTNLIFTGWSEQALYCSQDVNGSDDWRDWHCTNCAFVATGDLYQVAALQTMVGGFGPWNWYVGCTFFGVDFVTSGGYAILSDCLHVGCLERAAFIRSGITWVANDYNAAADATVRGTNGINTGTYPPPVRSSDPVLADMAFDPVALNVGRYLSSGYRGGRVGATCGASVVYRPDAKAHRIGDTTFPTTIINSSNNKIDFLESDGGTERVATISSATYSSGTTLATAIQSALNAAPGKVNTYTVTWVPAERLFHITSDGAFLSLLWSTGTNTAVSAAIPLGFDPVFNSTGGVSYWSTEPRVYGGAIFGAWANDPSYYDPSYPPTVVDETNDKINFLEEDAGTELTATLAHDTYTSGAALATAFQTALNTAPGRANDYVVAWQAPVALFRVSSSGEFLSLLWNTGTDVATSASAPLGFDDASDDTGAVEYEGDFPRVVGKGSRAPSDATAAVYNGTSFFWYPDVVLEPEGKSCCSVSPVEDNHRPVKLQYASIMKYVDGLGEIDNELANVTRKIEVRGRNTPFRMFQEDGTNLVDWTMIELNEVIPITTACRYWQYRVVPRINATF